MTRRDRLVRLVGPAALASYGALLWAEAPAWPDDWDGVGFVASVRDFDLARFHPHPPGYPVYVAMLRAAQLLTRDPMRACVLVAAASGVLSIGLSVDAARRRLGPRAAMAVGVLVAVMPLAFRAASGVGSEAPALACAAGCAWGMVLCPARRRGGFALGLAAGLGLGVRLSWAPLYLAALALAPRGSRARAWAAAAAACAAWAAPLIAIVGPTRLLSSYATQLAGHAARWGGTVMTEPGWRRAGWLARDLLVDGLGIDRDPLGVALAVLLAAAGVQGALAWRAARWAGWRAALVLLLPYLAWIAVGQNLRDQPRHVLPLAAMLAAALAFPVAGSRRALGLVAALALAMSARTALDAGARRAIPPPGQQLVALARAQPSPDRLDVFGVSSVRFFEPTELAAQAFPAGSLGDVQVRLSRLDRLPARVWVTSELTPGNQSRWPLWPVATLCRPVRLDRREPCLSVSEWRPSFLPPR